MSKETQNATVTISYKLFESMKNELKTFKEDGLIYMSTKHGIKLYGNKECGTKQIIEDLTKKFETELKTVHGVVSSCHKKIQELESDVKSTHKLWKRTKSAFHEVTIENMELKGTLESKKSFWNIFKTK